MVLADRSQQSRSPPSLEHCIRCRQKPFHSITSAESADAQRCLPQQFLYCFTCLPHTRYESPTRKQHHPHPEKILVYGDPWECVGQTLVRGWSWLMMCCGCGEFSLSSCSWRFYFSWSWIVDGCLLLHYAMHNAIPCKSSCATFEVCCQGETVNGHGSIHHDGEKERKVQLEPVQRTWVLLYHSRCDRKKTSELQFIPPSC